MILDLQKAILDRLTADTELVAIVPRIYADPPQDSDFPFAYLHQYEVYPDDTSGVLCDVVDFMIAVVDRPRGGGKTSTIKAIERIIELLHRAESEITVAGHQVISLEYESYTIDMLGDGLTFLGEASLESKLQQL